MSLRILLLPSEFADDVLNIDVLKIDSFKTINCGETELIATLSKLYQLGLISLISWV